MIADLAWPLFFVVMGAFLFGAGIGSRTASAAWRGAARGQPRRESKGKLYHVVEHGDLQKAREVLDWMEHDARHAESGPRP